MTICTVHGYVYGYHLPQVFDLEQSSKLVKIINIYENEEVPIHGFMSNYVVGVSIIN